jgi:hypothetical protein
MNRRRFLTRSLTAAAAAALAPSAAWAAVPAPSRNRSRTKIAAYYLRAQMYTCVPHQIREDMEWMADKGTDYVCPAFLEQDLFAAYENHALIAEEARRAGMQVLAVPSRWGGLTAGAPKVPSLFSMLNPQTLIVNKKGSTALGARTSGGISSVHHPDTFRFFCETLAELYRQHPQLAGFILDEPKCFVVDYSPMAVAALGRDAPRSAHYAAVRDFFSRICAYAKQRWPDKLTLLFQQAHNPDDELEAGAAIQPLDYYGADGRPWGPADDLKMQSSDEGQESGKGKILLGGKGEKFLALARRVPGRKAFFLIENHNLSAAMVEPLDRNYPAVLALGADLAAYYYYPRNVAEPERTMEIIGRHLKKFTQG